VQQYSGMVNSRYVTLEDIKAILWPPAGIECMSTIQVACPGCRNFIAVPDNVPAGTNFRCPQCRAVFGLGTLVPRLTPDYPSTAPQAPPKEQLHVTRSTGAVSPVAGAGATGGASAAGKLGATGGSSASASVPKTPSLKSARVSAPKKRASRRGSAPLHPSQSTATAAAPPPSVPGMVKAFIILGIGLSLLFLLAAGGTLGLWWIRSNNVADNSNVDTVPIKVSKKHNPDDDTRPGQEVEGQKQNAPGKTAAAIDPTPDREVHKPDAPSQPGNAADKKLDNNTAGQSDKAQGAADPQKQVNTAPANQNGDPAAVPLKKPVGPKKVADKVSAKRVNEAIDHGVQYLLETYKTADNWPALSHKLGVTAFAGLTLLVCDVAPNDPVVLKTAAEVRTKVLTSTSNYDLATSILFLDKLGDKADEGLIRLLASRLLAGQNQSGGWSYECPILTDLQAIQSLALTKKEEAAGLMAVQNVGSKANGDNSNTQFALLALWAARRHDVPVKKALSLAGLRFRTFQLPGGGWGYNIGDTHSASPAMACVGLLGLAMAKAVLADKAPAPTQAAGTQAQGEDKVAIELDEYMRKGFDSLVTDLHTPSADAKAKFAGPNLYMMWSVERVGVLYEMPKIKGFDWYQWGVNSLLPRQKMDGSWDAGNFGYGHTVDTCLALLFLKRANLVQDLTDSLFNLQGISLPKGK
jgi:hypothetical protein